jgi:plastocyanin
VIAADVPRPAITVGIAEREYAIAVYRPRIRAGKVVFALTNRGEDGHDLAVVRAGRTYGHTAEIRPGHRATLRLTLRHPGLYRLVCTLADHERLGMRATLRVLPAKIAR